MLVEDTTLDDELLLAVLTLLEELEVLEIVLDELVLEDTVVLL